MQRALLIMVLLWLGLAVHAQDNTIVGSKSTSGSRSTSGGNSTIGGVATSDNGQDTTVQQPKGVVYHTDLPDSLLQGSVFGFRRSPYEPKIMQVFHPVFDPTAVQHSHPAERHDGSYYLTAGELGHPHYDAFFNTQASESLKLRLKPSLYPGFYKSPENIVFYQVQRPYTLLAYHSSIDKDYQLHVTHSQNVHERWNVALDYHLYSPEGVYANNAAVDHLLDFNTNYYSRDSRYQMRGGALWQRFSLGENGGLSNDSLFIYKSISNAGGFPVVSTTASSRSTDVTLFANQTFNTVRQLSWHRNRMILTLNDSTALFDTTYVVDTLYPSEPRVLNAGIFGLNLQYNRNKYRGTAPMGIDGGTVDSMLFHRIEGTLYWTNDAWLDHRWHNPLKVTVGVRPSYAAILIDTTNYTTDGLTLMRIYPFAYVTVSPWQWGKATLQAEYELMRGGCLFDLCVDAVPNKRNLISLRGTLKREEPHLLHTVLQYQKPLSMKSSEYNTIIPLPLMTLARGEMSYQYLSQHGERAFQVAQCHLMASVSDIHDAPFFMQETSGLMTTGFSTEGLLLQGRLGLNLEAWRWLHLDMQQLVQYATHDVVRVPLFASKNSLYADFYLFHHALRTQVGADLRYHTRFMADGYDPSLGLFYRQNDVEVGNYLYADFFINLQVKRASIYVKAGHINSFLESEAHYFSIPHYAEKPFALFYGLTWQFFD